MQDSKILHFLKEFPAWCVLLCVFIFVATMYLETHDAFMQRLVDGAMGALFTALVAQRPKAGTNITTDRIETGDVLLPDQSSDKSEEEDK